MIKDLRYIDVEEKKKINMEGYYIMNWHGEVLKVIDDKGNRCTTTPFGNIEYKDDILSMSDNILDYIVPESLICLDEHYDAFYKVQGLQGTEIILKDRTVTLKNITALLTPEGYEDNLTTIDLLKEEPLI